ncbi:TPA_asm: portal protein [Altiarchaeum virus]|nr:TPA_asm: portal protein [Altiarchaeum virus]
MSLLQRIYRAYSELRGQRISQVSEQSEEMEKERIAPTRADYYKVYRTCPPLFRAIQIRATIASHYFSLKSETDIVEKLLSSLDKTSGMAKLRDIVFRASIMADVEGSAFTEIHLDRNMRPTLSLLHSESVDFGRDDMDEIIYDEYGRPKMLVQTNNFRKIPIPMSRISSLSYSKYGDEPYGIPITGIVYDAAKSYSDVLKSMAQYIKTVGFPVQDFSVGDAEHEPNADTMKDVQRGVKNFSETAEYVHEYFIKRNLSESKMLPQSTVFVDPFVSAIAIASGVPEFTLTGKTKELSLSSARVMTELLPKILLPSMQSSIEQYVEDIFHKIAAAGGRESDVNLVFNPIFSTDKEGSAKVAEILSKIPNLCTPEEIRKIAGLEPTK